LNLRISVLPGVEAQP